MAGSVLGAGPSARGAGLPDESYTTLPCRPTIACTADIVRPGALELETGAQYRRIDSTGRQWTFPWLAKLTVADWVQLQLGSNGYSWADGPVPAQYQDDALVGAKFKLKDQTETIPSLSFSAIASIPTFERQVGYLRTYDALFTAYATKDWGPVHADLNGGINLWRLDGAPRPQAFWALAVSLALPAPFGVMAEVYSFTDASPVVGRDGGLLLAVSHSPRSWLMFDAGGDIGWFPSTRAFSLFVGMTLIPVVLWNDRP